MMQGGGQFGSRSEIQALCLSILKPPHLGTTLDRLPAFHLPCAAGVNQAGREAEAAPVLRVEWQLRGLLPFPLVT